MLLKLALLLSSQFDLQTVKDNNILTADLLLDLITKWTLMGTGTSFFSYISWYLSCLNWSSVRGWLEWNLDQHIFFTRYPASISQAFVMILLLTCLLVCASLHLETWTRHYPRTWLQTYIMNPKPIVCKTITKDKPVWKFEQNRLSGLGCTQQHAYTDTQL